MLQATMSPRVKAIHFKLVMLSKLLESLEVDCEQLPSDYLDNGDLDNPLEVIITLLPHVALSVCESLRVAQISTAIEVFHKQLRELALCSPVNASTLCRARSLFEAVTDLDTRNTNEIAAPICLDILSREQCLQTQICIILTKKFAESVLRILSVRARDESTDVFCDILRDTLRTME